MQKNDVLVSIVVPVYGTEAYLPACVESICNQTYKNIQIILVDDQSPDRCPEICDTYAQDDSRIQVIHQENQGVSGARNTGLHYAIGDYIMFVDSDDELYPDAVKILVEDVRRYDADIVSATQKIVNNDRRVISANEDGGCVVLQGEAPLRLSLAGDETTISACAKLFKAAFLKDVCFYEGKNIHEDGFFLFQCCLKEPVWVQHNIAVYQYNLRDGSNSRQQFSDKYLAMLYYCDRKKALLEESCYQYADQVRNMEVRTNLQMLDLLCSTTNKKYKALSKQCVNTVRELYAYHVPINGHHQKLAWIVKHGLYPVYKCAVRLKYYR